MSSRRVPSFVSKADGLAVLQALLAAIAVLRAVLADLQVARHIDDFADDRDDLAGDRLAVDGGRDGGHAPGVIGLLADLSFGFVEGAFLGRELRVQNIRGDRVADAARDRKQGQTGKSFQCPIHRGSSLGKWGDSHQPDPDERTT